MREEVLTDYLEGSLDPVVKNACEAHLIACDSCRQDLALFMRVLREDVTPEEEVKLQRLSEIWEERNLKPIPPPWRLHVSAKHILYSVAAIAAALVLALALGWRPLTPTLSEAAQIVKVLANNRRLFEPRVVGQRYMAIEEVTRSGESAGPNVLAAEMSGESAGSPYEVGRYFLLSGQYVLAIEFLKKAVADPGIVYADVHNDLGVAFLESNDYVEAEAQFRDALQRSPDHKPAAFNLSLLYEREHRLDAARQQWRRYLELDRASGWAKEVEVKLSRKEPAVR